MNLNEEKKNFKNHIATFTDYGNIKILDFKDPSSSYYRIRFLFEEDYCRLHISGDLGQLIATNYNNMTYNKFSDFIDNIGYFNEKINCHDRNIFRYDIERAESDIKEYIKEYELTDTILEAYDDIDDFIDTILEDFNETTGIGQHGYDIFSNIDTDVFEIISDFGKESTEILNLYMLAFKLAQENLTTTKVESKETI